MSDVTKASPIAVLGRIHHSDPLAKGKRQISIDFGPDGLSIESRRHKLSQIKAARQQIHQWRKLPQSQKKVGDLVLSQLGGYKCNLHIDLWVNQSANLQYQS